jgi:prepilin-type N-terminal cleavage/methylation domain-containing protein
MLPELLKRSFISVFVVLNNSKIHIGFTLAEVLITLLIVGIISSIVIPGIINDSQEAECKTAYKKAIAVASQVLQQCYNENLFESRTNETDAIANSNNFNQFMAKFSIQKQCISNNNTDCWDPSGETSNGAPSSSTTAFMDTSGMAWSARCPPINTGCTSNNILVDTNGFKKPNKYGKDRWVLKILDRNNQPSGVPIKIGTYGDVITDKAIVCPNGSKTPCYYRKWLIE